MSTIGCNDTTSPRLCLFINYSPGCPKRHPGLYKLNRLVQTFTTRLHDPHAVGIRKRFVTNVVCLVQVAVETAMVQRHVNVDDVTINQASPVRDPVADDLVDRCADGLRETVVIERRGV